MWRFLRQARSDRRYREAAQVRERAWEELLRSLHVQTLVLANSGLGIAHIKDRLIQWANPRWGEIFGVPAERLAGASMAPFHRDAAAFAAFGRTGYATIEREGRFKGEIQFRRVDGSPFWAYLVGSLLVSGRPEEGAIWCLEDVSDRVDAQMERDDALRLNQKLIAASPTGILLYRAADGACILANQAAARITGGSIEALRTQNFRRNTAWAESGLLAKAEAALATSAEQRLDAVLTTSFGLGKELDCTFVPFASRGERILMLMVADLTERAHLMRELAQKNDDLIRARKMESLGLMAGGVAHDFNNLFQAVQGNLELALLKAPDGGIKAPVDRALKILDKASLLTHRMLEYSGRSFRHSEILALNKLVQDCLRSLADPGGQRIEFLGQAGLPEIEGDGKQLAQVLTGLVLNAQESLGPCGGTVQVRTELRRDDPGPAPGLWIHPPPEGAAAVCLSVSDNGSGMSPEVLERAFDPFFTTHRHGRGLGLSAALGILRTHNAGLWVDTAAGRGTTFRIHFPVA